MWLNDKRDKMLIIKMDPVTAEYIFRCTECKYVSRHEEHAEAIKELNMHYKYVHNLILNYNSQMIQLDFDS